METTFRSQPSADEVTTRSSFRMIDVGEKPTTRRRALARGTIELSPQAFQAVVTKTNPKGDVLALAEVAAIQGAKRTSDLLPLCHPLLIDKVRVSFAPLPESCSITIFCEVATSAKTGVEMEALCAVNAGLLAVYDLSKAVDPVIKISDIRLDLKEGGKSGEWKHPEYVPRSDESAVLPLSMEGIKASIITVSDRCSRGEAQDLYGPAAKEFLESRGGQCFDLKLVPDEENEIQEMVLKILAHHPELDLLVLTGGTGISPRDRTPESVLPLLTRPIPGIGECLRAQGSKHTPMSYLSRSEGGLIGSTLVILLPGSVSGVKEGMAAIEPWLKHAANIAGGSAH